MSEFVKILLIKKLFDMWNEVIGIGILFFFYFVLFWRTRIFFFLFYKYEVWESRKPQASFVSSVNQVFFLECSYLQATAKTAYNRLAKVSLSLHQISVKTFFLFTQSILKKRKRNSCLLDISINSSNIKENLKHFFPFLSNQCQH